MSKAVLGYRCVKRPTERHGSYYGGWVMCPNNITRDSVVYSFGVGEDVSFDLSLVKKYGLTVYTFDPTPRSIAWIRLQHLPERVQFHDFGVAGFDGIAKFSPPENPAHVSYTILGRPSTADCAVEGRVHRLSTIMRMLGHCRVDILKMDVEGAEYAVIEDLIDSKIEVDQILVEFHHRFENVGIQNTRRALKLLSKSGYRVFSISPKGEEYSLIRA